MLVFTLGLKKKHCKVKKTHLWAGGEATPDYWKMISSLIMYKIIKYIVFLKSKENNVNMSLGAFPFLFVFHFFGLFLFFSCTMNLNS